MTEAAAYHSARISLAVFKQHRLPKTLPSQRAVNKRCGELAVAGRDIVINLPQRLGGERPVLHLSIYRKSGL